MAKKLPYTDLQNFPACAADFVKLVIKKMRYRKKVRADVMAELAAHFEDELKEYATDEEKEQKAQRLIAEFGDVKLLAVLLRRAKKRCRPLWRTVVARTFQTVGILISCLIVYIAWFLSGKPSVTIDYVAELNRVVRPVADENLNAAPLYKKAIELYEKSANDVSELLSKKYSEVTVEQKQLIKKWIEGNSEALELVIAGTQKPYYWQKYEGEEMLSVLPPNLAGFRKLAYSLRWRAHLQAEQGRYKNTFDDIKSCYRFGQHLRGDKILIEQLVGIAIESLTIGTVREILSEYQIDSAILATLQKDIEKLTANEDFVVSVKAEKLCMYDEIQRCFTNDRLGDGHLYLSRITALSRGCFEEKEKVWELMPWIVKVLFVHPNKQQTREMAEDYWGYWDRVVHKTPARIRAENIDIEKQVTEIVKGNIFLKILSPAIRRVNEISYRLPADVKSTLTIIAILRYRQDVGSCPEELKELVTAGYLKELPMDSFSDKPLVYKKTDDDFILYSVGHNFTDDGGVLGKDKKGEFKLWTDEGDAVFWPVRK